MIEIEKTKEMRAGVDRVWEVLSDTDKDEEYWGAIRDIKVLKRAGNTTEREATVGPRAFAHKSKQTIVLDPKKSIALTISGEWMAGERTITLAPKGEAITQVDVSWKLDVKDVPGFVQGIVKGQLSKSTEDALKKFQQKAEGAPRAEREQDAK